MTLKKQVHKLKENWLIVVLVLLLVIFLNGNFFNNFSYGGIDSLLKTSSYAEESVYRGDTNFAPEVEDRIKTVTSRLSTEVDRGDFFEAEVLMKNLVNNYKGYLLNEYAWKSESGFFETDYGSYTIKVDSTKYESFISDLKNIGEVQSFNENTIDITGQYTDLEIELELERDKLTRYQNLYNEAKDIEDKITLEGMIASQERTIKYLEDRINNLDKRVDYATVYFSLNEKSSGYAGIALVKLSELVKGFVNSVNTLLKFFFVILPWVIIVFIVYKIYRKFKR